MSTGGPGAHFDPGSYHERRAFPGERMLVDFYGLRFETPQVTFYLWSPWRAAALEHRLFDSLTGLPGVHIEKEEDELRVHVKETKIWKQALLNMCRILK